MLMIKYLNVLCFFHVPTNVRHILMRIISVIRKYDLIVQ